MRAYTKILIAVIAFSLLAALVYGQTVPLPTGFPAGGKVAPLQRFFKILSDPWVMIFVLVICAWAIFYFMYRMGLEKSGQVPAAYCHKLATVLSFLSAAPILWKITTAADPKALVRAVTLGYIGPGALILLGIFGLIIFGALGAKQFGYMGST
ncbi:MAG: hypothetical protein AABX47_06220 [Nanoarchaeota archaeon]